MTGAEILKVCKEERVRFIRLQFIDILGVTKNVEIPESQFEKALDQGVIFDGSSIEGFSRIEEADMVLRPDTGTFRVFPFEHLERGKVGRLICDVRHPNGQVFEGCPRSRLKVLLEKALRQGYTMHVGFEAEFFLFRRDETGRPMLETHDSAGYFDLAPVDRGEEARRDMVNVMEAMGFEVEGAHHEVAPGQHEIDFKFEEALAAADDVTTFKLIVRKVAQDHGLHATFMPKPIFGVAGSGMHTHQCLFQNGQNAFFDPEGENQLSATALHYIAGLLKHAPGFCAITNPLVNSYKRLVPGFEAPTNVAWSEQNRSPLIRVPAPRELETRCELRMPDPSCNPYLAVAVMLEAGLDGIARKLTPPPPVSKSVYTMSVRERRRHKIADLPSSLNQAVLQLRKDKVIQKALGDHIYRQFVVSKRQEWATYVQQIHQWELDTYLGVF
ncbi:MAG: type I glutamate--ammonia ligase [Acidobacteriota bacterium]|nr:MAG: type I glutamate--ammonia ligase [Acidobacteriota bacterium]